MYQLQRTMIHCETDTLELPEIVAVRISFKGKLNEPLYCQRAAMTIDGLIATLLIH